MRQFKQLFLAVGLLTAGLSFAADINDAAPLRKVAIIVENHAGAQFNDKVAVLEDLLSSRIAGEGYSVISRDVTVNALKSYDTAGIAVASQTSLNASAESASTHSSAAAVIGKVDSAQTTAIGIAAGNGTDTNSAALDLARKNSAQIAAAQAQIANSAGQSSAALDLAKSGSAQVAVTPETSKLDQSLNDNTSALRLAQNLGADFILVPSITTYGTEKQTYNGNGMATVNITHTLRVSYKIAEAGAGGEIRGGTVAATKTIRQTSDLSTDDSDLINGLLDDAAGQLADAIKQNATSLPTEVAKSAMVEITVSCGMQDLAQLPISVPDIRVLGNGTLLVQTNRLAVQVLDATVEVNGIAVGSAPGEFKVPPGLNKMRITREGFNTWERTVNFSEGQKFNVALQMSDAGYARWKDNTAFLLELETAKKLTDGTVKMMDGFAQTLQQSGFRIDIRDESKGKSLFDGAGLKAF